MRRSVARDVLVLAVCVGWLAIGLAAGRADAAAPPASIHQIEWLIHEDLVTAERPLQGFWVPLIEAASRDGGTLVRGGQGPFDQTCCMGFEALSVAAFSDSGTGFDLLTIDGESEFDALDGIGAGGARVFLVQALNWCQGPGTPIGCADFPFCGSEPAARKAVLSLEAYEEFDSLGQVMAHELGHTTCLDHVFTESCELMAASSGGGCLSTVTDPECSEFAEDAQVVSGTCACYSDASSFAPDGQACAEVANGVCSGGVCGDASGEAGVAFFAAGDPIVANGGFPNQLLRASGASGHWASRGIFSANRALGGLAYAPGRDVLYGVAHDGGDTDLLLSVDPETGATATIGTITGLDENEELVGLAWDPGASALLTDDRLFAIDTDQDGLFSSLYAIDPDTAVATKLSVRGIDLGGGGGFRGLAYDPVNGILYASAGFTTLQGAAALPTGLFRIETVCGFDCTASEVVISDPVGQQNKFDAGLAYDATTHRIYHVGRQSGDRTEYDSYDADDLAANVITKPGTRGIDAFSVGGLAIRPVPEPRAGTLALVALGGLALLGRCRRPGRPAAY